MQKDSLMSELGDREAMRPLLRQARSLAAGKVDLARARERARRHANATPGDLVVAADLALEMTEEEADRRLAILEILQAASVGICAVRGRSLIAGSLAVAAKAAGQIERARQAYADVMAGLQIVIRHLGDDGSGAQAERSVTRGWEAVREQSDLLRDVFDLATADPATELHEQIVWNTDLGSEHCLLSQIDATLRLAQQFEHLDRQGHVDWPALAADMVERSKTLRTRADPLRQPRHLVTLGDALMEVEKWDVAAGVLAAARAAAAPDHPVGMHAAVQEAWCHMQTGRQEACQAALGKVDKGQLENLAGLVVTVAAELARYLTVEHGLPTIRAAEAESLEERAWQLAESTAIIVKSDGRDRTSYLRHLFHAVLVRDIEARLGGRLPTSSPQ